MRFRTRIPRENYRGFSPFTNGGYNEYAPDFFDLVIVDDRHRGSAQDNSTWREILERFAPARLA